VLGISNSRSRHRSALVADKPIPGWVEVHLELADAFMSELFYKPPIFKNGDLLFRDA
jgi:hypothetical protein